MKSLQEENIETILSRNPREIRNKREFYLLYDLGLFGNKPLTWKSYDEIAKSGWKGNVCIRGTRTLDRKLSPYNLPLDEIKGKIHELRGLGFYESDLAFNQSMPDDHLLIQGEARLLDGWQLHALHLWYSTLQKPMNIALAEDSKLAYGVEVLDLLKPRMTESSYYDLGALIELFPNSAIEFSTYDIGVGNIPGRNTVIWEVRDY